MILFDANKIKNNCNINTNKTNNCYKNIDNKSHRK